MASLEQIREALAATIRANTNEIMSVYPYVQDIGEPPAVLIEPEKLDTEGSFGRGMYKWNLRLYTAGQSPKSLAALANLKKVCDEHLAGRYSIEVVDLMKNPRLAKDDQIVAIPTLVRKLPEPLRRLVGDLSDTERTLVGLQIKAGK